MKNETRLVMVSAFLLLVGIVVAGYLTVQHYNLLYGLTEAKSFCSINSKIDCDAVNTSQFSSIFGIPVSLIAGMALFIELLILIGFRIFTIEEKGKLGRFYFYLCCGNMIASIFLAAASSLVLKTYCLMCMSLWLVSLLLWICARPLAQGKNRGLFKSDLASLIRSSSENGSRGILFLFFLIPVGSVIGNGMWKQNVSGDLDNIVQNSLSEWKSNRKIDFFIEKSPEFGNPKASMQIVEFSDFQCPHCKRAAPSLHAFVNAHREDVHFIFQNYPLDPACNKEMKSGGHDQACLFAKAALCGNQQGKFSEVHDWIFGHQDILDSSVMGALITETKVDKTRFEECLVNPETLSDLEAQLDRGKLAGIEGTPSVFVNGRILPGGFMIPVLESALKEIKNSSGSL